MESEILALIDQLEALCSTGGRVPLSSRVMMTPSEVYHLLDQMRQSLPREIVRARHIYQERDRILQDAQMEADALRAAAKAERAALLAEHSIVVEAQTTAESVKREARSERERILLEADAYALHSLRDMQVQLLQTRQALEVTIKTVSGGIDMLEDRSHPGRNSVYAGTRSGEDS